MQEQPKIRLGGVTARAVQGGARGLKGSSGEQWCRLDTIGFKQEMYIFGHKWVMGWTTPQSV